MPVAARHRLHVVLRVPVRVEHDDRVGGGQVDADAAGFGREEEDEGLGRPACLEAVDGRLPLLLRHRAVETLIRQEGEREEVFEDVEHALHL